MWPLCRRRYQHSQTLPNGPRTSPNDAITQPSPLTSLHIKGPLQDAKTGTTSMGSKAGVPPPCVETDKSAPVATMPLDCAKRCLCAALPVDCVSCLRNMVETLARCV
ncbi:hypothetical protein M419DRAFT_124154 [Trichoderma reesei RUT C-30]|uniref:Uncharacterized protein n=1 Tax=Hypocrea jecorina (strain ATCC 56765 / BCRC 32924 / NRRL 11460 / Rut C-30) TaxID=1344414 RepID=A0A024S4P5_HYPJR|nr:hypothetical protein M419DRAFT_124154 [Trichoderma reesei RUT C-30]